METIRERLEEDLRTAVGRLRQMGGAVAVEDVPGAIGDNSPFADEVDEIQANERREIGFATRELLVGRVNRLSAALDRLNDGVRVWSVRSPFRPPAFRRCRRSRPACGARTGSSALGANSIRTKTSPRRAATTSN